MAKASDRPFLRIVAGVLLLFAASAVGWWLGTRGATQAVGQTAPAPAVSSAEGPPAAATGTPDPFALLECSARLFEDAPALAVTFTQPLAPGQDLSSLLRVTDAGPAPDSATRDGADSRDGKEQAKAAPADAAATPVAGAWVVADNPRVAYFPHIKPLRQYRVAAASAIAAADGGSLPEPASCEATSQAMPPAFYFASRGVVLPPGQNGGLPIVTVNVPEVDVEFLRIDTARIPYFYDNILGVRRAPSDVAENDEDADDADDDWRYSSNRALQGNVSLWDLDRLGKMTQSVYSGRFLTGEQPDRRHLTFLPVEDIEALQQPGIYVAVMTQPGRFRYESQVSYFYVSDIGVHLHRHPEQLDAYATSLKSGLALADTSLDLLDGNGKVLATAKADDQGRVRFDGRYPSARLLTARRGAEQTVLALQQPALDLSEFQARGYPSRTHRLYAYAGRDLYRPGETFHVSLLARDADGRGLPPMPITATLKRPDGRVMRTDTWQPGAGTPTAEGKLPDAAEPLPQGAGAPGYFQQAITLPPDAQTGTWQLELRIDPATPAADTTWRFQVEEFLPERMKLALTPSAPTLLSDQPLNIEIQGDYLYGAPAAGNRVLARLAVERQRQPLAQQWPGFIFGDVADDDRRQWQELEEQELDEAGHASLAVPLTLEDAHSPMAVTTSVSLLESGGRPVIRSSQSIVWPAPALIGLRPQFDGDVVREGTLAAFEVARVGLDGELAPLASAQLRLFREEREYYWRFDDQGGWNSGYIDTEELVESRELDLSARSQITVPVQWGRYRLEITDPELGQTLRYRFYAGWGAQDAEAMGNRPDRVQLKLNPAPAESGRDLNVRIEPPHDGHAVVTVESDRVLWSRRLPVSATGTELNIPLDPAWQRHDLYVSAVVFRPGSEGEARVTPARAVGLAHIPLDRSARQLAVAIDAPAKIRPETRGSVKVRVSGAAGGTDTAWVTLSAVDAGILSITNFASPDPFDFFFGQQRYGAEMLDMYGRLIEKMHGTRARLKWGGDAAQRDTRSLPPKVRLVDLFSGPVRLDADGRADIPLDLPDFNGTLRLMATAFTETEFGSAEREMVVAAPIVAELSMPRFIGTGDAATLALDVTNLTEEPRRLDVTLKAEAPAAITDSLRALELAPGERRILHYTVTGAGASGDALLTLDLKTTDAGKPLHISRRATLAVQPTTPPARLVNRLRLAPGEQTGLNAEEAANWLADTLTAGIMASGTPPFDMRQLARDLLDYPYGCTEQTASAAYPYLLLDDAQAKDLGLPGISAETRNARLASAVPRLAAAQKASGGFSLWGEGPQDIWLTAYTVQFLQDAGRSGYAVPQDMLKRAREWLLERLREAPARFPALPAALATHDRNSPYSADDYRLVRDSHERFSALAFAGYVLAREQAAPLAALRQLYEGYADRARSPLPLVHLAAALQLTGDQPRAAAALDAAMARPHGIDASRARYGEWLGDYGSPVRDYAWSYAIMHEHKLEHPRRETLLTDLLQHLGKREWFSTQERLALLQAAQAAGGRKDAVWSLEVRNAAGTHRLASGAAQSATLTGPDALSATLTNTGDAPVFIETQVQGRTPPGQAPRSEGVRIERQWYTADGQPWNGGELQTGDTLIVGLTATAEVAIANALIVDYVPAGFDIENLNLSQGDDMQGWELGGQRVEAALNDPRIAHREYRDDRYVAAVSIDEPITVFYRVNVTNPGIYHIPAATVEDMYRPQIRATGHDGGKLTIVSP